MPLQGPSMYPWNFGPDQQVNAFSNWNDRKYNTGYLGQPTDALGNPIAPPPGYTLAQTSDPALAARGVGGDYNSAVANKWAYPAALANPNPVATPGPAYNPNRPMPGPNNNINQILAMLQQSQGQNAPGAAPATGGVPGITLGGGSSAPSFSGSGLGFTNALAALQGMGAK